MNVLAFLWKVAGASGMKSVQLDGCTMTPWQNPYSSHCQQCQLGEERIQLFCFRSVPVLSPSRCPYQLVLSHFSRPYKDGSRDEMVNRDSQIIGPMNVV